MLISSEEYHRMYEAESKMWWYKILHERVIAEIKVYSEENRTLKILDAGCGTGGLLTKLKAEGFSEIQGFDFSIDAVALSQSRGLNVTQRDITSFAIHYPAAYFDIVVSDDVLYQFDDPEISSALKDIYTVLKPGGIFISNNNAFSIFGGIHDIAVGSKRRFVKSDFIKFFAAYLDLSIDKSSYWPLLISPMILGVRLLQKLQLKLGLVNTETIESDVSMPSNFINTMLYKICKLELQLIKKSPFGSSLFMVIRKSE